MVGLIVKYHAKGPFKKHLTNFNVAKLVENIRFTVHKGLCKFENFIHGAKRSVWPLFRTDTVTDTVTDRFMDVTDTVTYTTILTVILQPNASCSANQTRFLQQFS